MITKIKIPLTDTELNALVKASIAELRNPTDQAKYIIVQNLENRGFLTTDHQNSQTNQDPNQKNERNSQPANGN
jgi:hypothetical protein